MRVLLYVLFVLLVGVTVLLHSWFFWLVTLVVGLVIVIENEIVDR